MGRGKGTIARVNSSIVLQSTEYHQDHNPCRKAEKINGYENLKENVPENQAFTRVWASKASFVASRSDQDREKRRFGERT